MLTRVITINSKSVLKIPYHLGYQSNFFLPLIFQKYLNFGLGYHSDPKIFKSNRHLTVRHFTSETLVGLWIIGISAFGLKSVGSYYDTVMGVQCIPIWNTD